MIKFKNSEAEKNFNNHYVIYEKKLETIKTKDKPTKKLVEDINIKKQKFKKKKEQKEIEKLKKMLKKKK